MSEKFEKIFKQNAVKFVVHLTDFLKLAVKYIVKFFYLAGTCHYSKILRCDDEFKFLHSYILIILFKNSAYSDPQQLLFKNTSN